MTVGIESIEGIEGIESIEGIEKQIEHIQAKIISLSQPIIEETEIEIPVGPNLARGAAEMWQAYQYRLQRYNELMNLSTETEYLQELLALPISEHNRSIEKRIHQLAMKETAKHPQLEIPMTSVIPLCWEQKVLKAKAIAHNMIRTANPDTRSGDIRRLQGQLMILEEQYINKMI